MTTSEAVLSDGGPMDREPNGRPSIAQALTHLTQALNLAHGVVQIEQRAIERLQLRVVRAAERAHAVR